MVDPTVFDQYRLCAGLKITHLIDSSRSRTIVVMLPLWALRHV